MKIVKPSVELLWVTPNALQEIERAGRTCYQSADRITPESAAGFVERIIKRGHDSVIEHAVASFRVTCPRHISHEIVRHRLASYSQRSTRYVASIDRKQFAIETEEDVIASYERGKSMLRIAELSQGRFTERQVRAILDRDDIERRPPGNHGIVHHDFFDTIDRPEKAYLLGMIQADGSVHRDGTGVTLTQKQDLSWFLRRTLRDFIRPSIRGSKCHTCHEFSITSSQIHQSLIAKGIIPNKTYESGEKEAALLWQAVPQELIWDFLRGYMDGNGGIRFYQQDNASHTDRCNINWAGPRHLIERIADQFEKDLGYHANAWQDSNSEYLSYVRIGQPQVGEEACRRMYKNFVFPYGHPIKTSRAWERIHFPYPTAQWGDPRFTVISSLDDSLSPEKWIWAEAMDIAEDTYYRLSEAGHPPEIARSVLPLCLETELVWTCNLREWRTILGLRTSAFAHPQMRELAGMIHKILADLYPPLFDKLQERSPQGRLSRLTDIVNGLAGQHPEACAAILAEYQKETV